MTSDRTQPAHSSRHGSLRFALPAVLMSALAAVLPAQKDRIQLVDGKVIADCTVTAYDIRKIEYRAKGSTETVESDQVAEVVVAKVKDTFKRAYASITDPNVPGMFVEIADATKDAFLAQFGYAEAARLLIEAGSYSDAFTVLEQLATKHPDSGFVPMLYRAKLDYYISQGSGKASDAASVARKYDEAASAQGYPRGFQLEARYYGLMAQGLAGSSDAGKLRRDFATLAGEASEYANVANRCRLVMAEIDQQSGKTEDAENLLRDLIGKAYLEPQVRASALRSIGDVEFAKGTSGDVEPYKRALLAYLRVWVEAGKSAPGVAAEALFKGAQAAEKWRGEDYQRIAARLRYTLKRDYADSEWAKK
jgi:hypothetical protein